MQTQTDFLCAKFGPDWVLAPRLTAKLRRKGYLVAVPRKAYAAAELEWARGVAALDPGVIEAARVMRSFELREAAHVLASQPVEGE
jgi:hypothetical protein